MDFRKYNNVRLFFGSYGEYLENGHLLEELEWNSDYLHNVNNILGEFKNHPNFPSKIKK